MGYTGIWVSLPGGESSGGLDLIHAVRDGRNRFGAIVMQALLSVAALVVLVLGPFVVQCRAPNGTLAAKFLFSECSPEVGCCDALEDVTAPHAVSDRGDSGTMSSDDIPCAGCSENALFLFVGSRGSRDDSKLVGSIPCVVAEAHPAGKLTAEIADERLAGATLLEAPLLPDGIHRVLRI
jgi:hypothetical protein